MFTELRCYAGMDLKGMPLFEALTKRMGWLSQRSRVLAENVANADTPDFRPKDLKPQDFAAMVTGRAKGRLQVAATDAQHLALRRGQGDFAIQFGKVEPGEASPTGNAVNLEEQMSKIGQTQVDYQLVTELYRKHLGILRTALGRGGSAG